MSEKIVIEQLIDPRWTVYAAPLIAILQIAEQLGIRQSTLLENVSVKAEELNIPDRRFPVMHYFKLYQAVFEFER